MSNTDFEEPDGGAPGEAEPESVEPADEGGEGAGETELAAEEGDEYEQDVEEQPRSRATTRVQTALQQARDAQERADRLARELQEEREARLRVTTQGESPQQIAERLALLTPEERSEYKLNQAVAEMQRERALDQFKLQDVADKMAYDAKALSDKEYARLAPKVEQARVEYMRQGSVVPREALLKYLVGEEVLAARSKTGAQRRAGQANVARQTVQPANGRTDVRGDRRAAASTPAKRLEGVII